MNNEFENGRYGTYIKYFENIDGYIDYLNSSSNVKASPNVSYCDGNKKLVKYNWEPESIVFTEETNEILFKLLNAANIPYSGENGYTVSDLASIKLEDIYCEDGGSGGFDDSRGYAELDDPEEYGYTSFCDGGVSIFYCFV